MNNDRASGFASVMIAVVTVFGAMMPCLATRSWAPKPDSRISTA